jgi:hypothetical protein
MSSLLQMFCQIIKSALTDFVVHFITHGSYILLPLRSLLLLFIKDTFYPLDWVCHCGTYMQKKRRLQGKQITRLEVLSMTWIKWPVQGDWRSFQWACNLPVLLCAVEIYTAANVQVRSHVFKQKGVEQVGVKQGLDTITFTTEVQNFPKL